MGDRQETTTKGEMWSAIIVKVLACFWVGLMLTAAVGPAPGYGGWVWIVTSVSLFVITLPIEKAR